MYHATGGLRNDAHAGQPIGAETGADTLLDPDLVTPAELNVRAARRRRLDSF
jgi:hypothetical protein